MKPAITAGLAYFAQIFALGFVLGTARVLWIAPVMGETAAVVAELPVMLAASWLASGRLLRRFGLTTLTQKALMGLLAFLLLMLAEAAVGIFAFGQPFERWLAGLFAMPGLLGFAGQILFAALPLLRR